MLYSVELFWIMGMLYLVSLFLDAVKDNALLQALLLWHNNVMTN